MVSKKSQPDEFLEAKKEKLAELARDVSLSELSFGEPESARVMTSLYDSYQPGRIDNLSNNRFSWIPPGPTWTGPDMFEHIPKAVKPFQFTPPGGQPVVPRRMYTDVGTIPRLVGVLFRGLTPWAYAPASIVHDWEFELHHCGRTNKTFEQVNDTMMQCLKTLMVRKIVPRSTLNFWLLYQGISSSVARRYWNRNPPKCTLPPDRAE